MCEMIKNEMNTRQIPYESITNQEVMKSVGITHVPVLELPNGQMMMAGAALAYIKGGADRAG